MTISPIAIERMIRESWAAHDRLGNKELAFIAKLFSRLSHPAGHPARRLTRGQLVYLQSTHLRALSRTHSSA